MKILFLGQSAGTMLHRYRALQRLGHEVDLVDYRPPLLKSWLGYTWTFRTGAFGTSSLIMSHLRAATGERRYDVAIVDAGELLGPEHVQYLKGVAGAVVNHNLDNPFTAFEGRKWRPFLQAVPSYDLMVTPRTSTVRKAYEAGAKRVLRLVQSADEVVHQPSSANASDRSLDVVFVGTWMPGRDAFMLRLLERGVPIRVFGARWSKAPEYRALSSVVTDGNLGDSDYVRTIGDAKIGLALLAKGNEDVHTTRSLEIPAIRTLLCAERTPDHLEMYEEGQEAVFWADAEDCAALCLELLSDEARIDRIAEAGRKRLIQNGNFNEQVLSRILAAVA